MGKWIDRAAFTALTAFVLYLLFLSAFKSVLAAMLLSFACCALLIHLHRGRTGKNRLSSLQAKTVLENWAYGPDDEAEAHIRALLSDLSGDIAYLPRHPSASLSVGDVFGAWKNHRGADRLILSAPCNADGRVRTFASTLTKPQVQIMDAQNLFVRIRRSDIPAPDVLRGRQLLRRLRESLAALPGRRPWHRNLLSGLLLMAMYLVTGSALYLALSIGALFISGVSLHMRT